MKIQEAISNRGYDFYKVEEEIFSADDIRAWGEANNIHMDDVIATHHGIALIASYKFPQGNLAVSAYAINDPSKKALWILYSKKPLLVGTVEEKEFESWAISQFNRLVKKLNGAKFYETGIHPGMVGGRL